ncbi:MAG: hypothetical protein NC253_05215 [Ruminococcus sp.]|nr:hypothetical protein [Ruminococcus sp.]MCM1380316.1 hypothetical protein [Muribaculaceae bacterium]MCM1478228.1 hypothetical protein [Muribaculaceae bacterium]
MTAEEILKGLQEYKRIKKNAEFEIRLHQSEVDEATKKLNESIKKRDNAILEIKERKVAIEAIPNRIYKEMIRLYFDEGKTWEEISEDVNYSSTQIYNYRPLALKEFQEAWDKKRKV